MPARIRLQALPRPVPQRNTVSKKSTLTKKSYANGQKAHEFVGTRLTYFFKNGKVKAEGCFVDDNMEGEWKFYRETGQRWQVGNFTRGRKNGSWVRYNRNGQVEYQEAFENDRTWNSPMIWRM